MVYAEYSITVVTPASLSLAVRIGASSCCFALVWLVSIGTVKVRSAPSASLKPSFFAVLSKYCQSMPRSGWMAPNTRFLSTKSPDHLAVSPWSWRAANCTPLTAPAFASEPPSHRYGACFSASALVMPPKNTTIFLATRSAANTWPAPTGLPPMLGTVTTTANGFFSATLSASARCAASSGPVGVTTSYSNLRPHVL